MISPASNYEYTYVFGEGDVSVKEGGNTAAELASEVAEASYGREGSEGGEVSDRGEESRAEGGQPVDEGQVEEEEDAAAKGQPATAFCICPLECVGKVSKDCSKIVHATAQKRSAKNHHILLRMHEIN